MWNFNGNIVEKSNGCGPDAEHIVNIHRHAVDADGVVLIHHLSDDDLCTNAVGGDGNTQPIADIDDVSKVTKRHFDAVRSEGKCALDPIGEVMHDAILLFSISTCTLIGWLIAHCVTSTANSL